MVIFLFLLFFGTANGLFERSRTNSTTSVNDFFSGKVELYERANFKGYKVSMPIKAPDACYNVDCFDNKASSAAWDLPADGNFDNHAFLAMFAEKNCNGMMHVWNLRVSKNDSNLAVKTHLNDQVSSIMVMKASTSPTSYVKTCSGGTTVSGGPSPLIYY